MRGHEQAIVFGGNFMKGNVFVVGVGLIGGSIALAIKKQHPNSIIYGYDANKNALEKAITLNIIDEKAASFKEGAENADLIILATPVLETKKLVKQLSRMTLKEGVIITDTGSTKGEIMEFVSEMFPKSIEFIGGHPMAGSHQTGVENARGNLFEDAYYLLTPLPHNRLKKIEELKNWLSGTNANFQIIDKDEHDVITGMVSHFPHLIAGALVNQTKKQAKNNPLIRLLAAGGFRDITRIASSSPHMWKDIVIQNRRHLVTLLENWLIEMQKLYNVLHSGNEQEIYDFFEEAKEYRDSLPGGLEAKVLSSFVLYIDVKSVPGGITQVLSLLEENRISMMKLELNESHSGGLGELSISFRTEEDRVKAQRLLQHNQFKTYKVA